MAQFDVHRNTGRSRAAVPYVVVVQSRRFDGFARRLVVPLVATSAHGAGEPGIAPVFRIEGQDVFLDPLQMQSVARETLGPFVASLADDVSSGNIINAIDLVISRAWG